MAVSVQNIEESLSVSYVSAVVAKAGASFDIVSRDYGVDVCVRRIDKFNGMLMDMGVSFDFQLKSTTNWEVDGSFIVYDIEADAYNKLIYRHNASATPCLLVLLCLPKDSNEWICLSEDELKLRKCGYFFYVRGEMTPNKRSTRIRIPRDNVLTPEAIKKLINEVGSGVLR
ncbi:hypothetical protein AWU65_28145 [Paenibacillus glucanolyticus]|uniref:DUF4365 domain-containing protein n=1 Tax=Paenibacillus glucanolyticus TaxID=59843 RepID=A0A163EQP4_9BACL|nr:DUF4365 domain-containing protein [Paenibacillus glucanolyticus]KZS43950.1 hypothetical protein AWU65_28145 [Paenibacillus glucanolyticus]